MASELHTITAVHRWFGARLSKLGADMKTEPRLVPHVPPVARARMVPSGSVPSHDGQSSQGRRDNQAAHQSVNESRSFRA